MARTPEGAVKQACVSLLKQYGAYHHFTITGGYGNSGSPDILACCNGRFISIECKAGNNKPTALQEAEMAKITAAGGVALVIREDTLDLLKTTLERIRNDRCS